MLAVLASFAGVSAGFSSTSTNPTSVFQAAPTFGTVVVTGSYIGDGTAGRPIAGVGFQPDWVVVRTTSTQEAVTRTSTMIGPNSKGFGRSAPAGNRITSLDADGFTVGTNSRVNRDGWDYHYVAVQQTSTTVSVGSYVGDGTTSRSVTGLAHQPEVVVLIPTGTHEPVQRIAPDALTRPFRSGGGVANSVVSFDPTGFTVGDDASSNNSGETYHYVALTTSAGTIETGGYVGTRTQMSITGVGFQPEWVEVRGDENRKANQKMSTLAGNLSVNFDSSSTRNQGIRTLDSDGFTIGRSRAVNNTGQTYYWLALG